MSEVDRIFESIVDPWWERNRAAALPAFDELRKDIAPFGARVMQVVWNDVGRWFIRGKGGGEERELLGLQCLVEALRISPVSDYAAWTAFTQSNRPEVAPFRDRLGDRPRRPEPGDEAANRALVEDISKSLGELGRVS